MSVVVREAVERRSHSYMPLCYGVAWPMARLWYSLGARYGGHDTGAVAFYFVSLYSINSAF